MGPAHRRRVVAWLAAFLAIAPSVAMGQASPPANKSAKAAKPPKKPNSKPDGVVKFFRSESPLVVTLTTNIKRLRGDKDATAPWRAATLAYTPPGAALATVPVFVKTRGIWRLKTCEFPPLRLNFTSEAVKHTDFHGLDKPKLVNYCRNEDSYDQYLLQEFQLYRIYRLLTPISHAVRLMRITYADSATGKTEATRYGFIEEEPNELAARVGARVLTTKGATPNDLEPYQSALVGVFQYMIGNTDFAFSALHNAELLATKTGEFIPVVYDFDFAGAVNARYATADPRLNIRSVRTRLYRGFCVPPDAYPKVFAQFNAKKDSIYALYRDPLGKLLAPGTADETIKYFDEFYKIINDPRAVKDKIMDACQGKLS
ncbi:MAG TPA: hypothetical protein VK636_07035 [Gemmatimonadaceae bacterium]|nr:hypothetical protein [Gemmatimonadaceae bacterium]